MRILTALATLLLLAQPVALAQHVKEQIKEGAPGRILEYRGLVPGESTLQDVHDTLGEPLAEADWYNYKLTYPAPGRDGLFDVVHMTGNRPNSEIANIDAASIPQGYENENIIPEKLGDPEYILRMHTWSLLDYTEQGLRFSVNAGGKTTGVAYIPHGWRRVHSGARKVMDLTHLRMGKQPEPAQPADLDGLQCGTAEVIFTPENDDWLPYDYEVYSDLKARIAVFHKGDLTVALVGADLFGLGYPECMVIRDAAREMGVDHLIFGSSHSHSTGDTMGAYGHYPAKYIAHLQEQVIKGVEQALDNMQPVAEMRAVCKELPMDGARVHGLIRNARNPGVLDPTMNLVQAFDENGNVITTIINFACHPESIQAGAQEIDADFPGYMCDKLTEAGGFGQPVFLNGALGGMISGDNPERTHESSKETGEKFAEIVMDLIENATQPAAFEFNAISKRVEAPLTNPVWKERYEGEEALRSLYRGRIVTDMTYIKLGEAQFISVPGELLPETSFEILEQMDGYPRMLVGLGNDQIGYMVPPYDFRDGYYEERTSVGPSIATQVRDTALRMLAEE